MEQNESASESSVDTQQIPPWLRGLAAVGGSVGILVWGLLLFGVIVPALPALRGEARMTADALAVQDLGMTLVWAFGLSFPTAVLMLAFGISAVGRRKVTRQLGNAYALLSLIRTAVFTTEFFQSDRVQGDMMFLVLALVMVLPYPLAVLYLMNTRYKDFPGRA